MTNATNRLRLLLKREPGIFSRQEEADLRAVLDDHDELLTSMANVILVAARQGGEIATLMDGCMPSWRAQVADLDQRTAALADIPTDTEGA